MLAVVTMNVNWARKVVDGLGQFQQSFIGNAVVSVRQMDVAQPVLLSQWDVRFRAVDANHGFDAQLLERLKRGLALRLKGDRAGGDADIAAAIKADPRLAEDYKGYGVP